MDTKTIDTYLHIMDTKTIDTYLHIWAPNIGLIGHCYGTRVIGHLTLGSLLWKQRRPLLWNQSHRAPNIGLVAMDTKTIDTYLHIMDTKTIDTYLHIWAPKIGLIDTHISIFGT